jgi:hypothetical protein
VIESKRGIAGTMLGDLEIRDAPADQNIVGKWWMHEDEPVTVLNADPVSTAFRVLTAGGGASWHTSLPLRFERWSGSPTTLVINGAAIASSLPGYGHRRWQPFSMEAADQRLAELEQTTAAPTLFAGEAADDEPQSPLSASAVRRARQVLSGVATWSAVSPLDHISIFPMPDGGLQLQRSGPSSSISIEIPASPEEPVLAEFAADNEYWSKEFDNPSVASQFLTYALR